MAVGDIAIISSVHHPDDGRLVRWQRSLEGAGLRVVVDCPDRRAHGARRVLQRLARDLALPFRHRVRWLLVPDPDMAITGLIGARLRRIRIIADVHEDYVRVAADRDWSRGPVRALARAAARAASALASRADLTVVTDDEHPPLAARHRILLPNLPAAGELGDSGPADVTPRAIYIGDVRPSRGLRTMVDAILAAPPWRLDIVGPISDRDVDWVRQRVGGDAERVHLHGRMHPAAAWELARGAWIGLAMLDDNAPFQVVMPTKVYEYLSIGLPVASTPLPRVLERIGPSDALELVHPDELAPLLRAWADDPSRMQRARTAATAWRDEHIPPASPFDAVAAIIREMPRR